MGMAPFTVEAAPKRLDAGLDDGKQYVVQHVGSEQGTVEYIDHPTNPDGEDVGWFELRHGEGFTFRCDPSRPVWVRMGFCDQRLAVSEVLTQRCRRDTSAGRMLAKLPR